jgi:ATP-dependent DNA ligase
MGIKESALLQYIARYFEKDLESVKKMYAKKGDLGEVAVAFLETSPRLLNSNLRPLEIQDIMDTISKIKEVEGW